MSRHNSGGSVLLGGAWLAVVVIVMGVIGLGLSSLDFGPRAALESIHGAGLSPDSTPTNLLIHVHNTRPASSPGFAFSLVGSATGALIYSWSGTDGSSSTTTLLNDNITSTTVYTFKACDGSNDCATESFAIYVSNNCNSNTCDIAVGCDSGACANAIIGCTPGTVFCNIYAVSLTGTWEDFTWSGSTWPAPLSYSFAVGNSGNSVVTGNPSQFTYSSGGSYTVTETITDGSGTHHTNTIEIGV
jgi:hypothetical protein